MLSEVRRIAWNRWKIIGEAFGDFQARLFAVLFYSTIFVPFALGVRLFSDPLRVRKPPAAWVERAPVGHSVDEAQRQF